MLLEITREEAKKIGTLLKGFKFTKQQFEEVFGVDMLKECSNGKQENSIPRPKILLEETPGAIFKNKTWDYLYRLIKVFIKSLDDSNYPIDKFDFELEFLFRDDVSFILRIKEDAAAKTLGLETENSLKDPRPEMIIPEVREKISMPQSNLKH